MSDETASDAAEPENTTNQQPEAETPQVNEAAKTDSAANEAGESSPADGTAPEPEPKRVLDYLVYGLSIPERTLRSTTAIVGGALRESTELLVPQAFQSSKTYSLFVEQMFDFMTRDVGGVERPQGDNPQIEDYVARKTVGSFIDLAGLAVLHVSPMTVLALISDVAYGSKTYLQELADELKKNGVIHENSTIDSAADLLDAVSNTTAQGAESFDKPPISVEGLKETIEQTKEIAGSVDLVKVLPQSEVKRLWQDMNDLAKTENVSPMEMSSNMALFAMNKVGSLGMGALSTIRVAGNMFDRHILDHYGDALTEIREKGFYASLKDTSKPYLSAAWQNFSDDKETITEDVVTGRFFGKAWRVVCGWFGGGKKKDEEKAETANERE